MTSKCKFFTIIRHHDDSGVSGTGPVLDGVVFECGRVVVCWRTENSSICLFDNFDEFLKVHIASHPKNRTEFEWYDMRRTKCPK